jgi:hypothetical protein
MEVVVFETGIGVISFLWAHVLLLTKMPPNDSKRRLCSPFLLGVANNILRSKKGGLMDADAVSPY